MVNDTIADMLTRIRNANIMKYKTVSVLKSKMTVGIADILTKEGFIDGFVADKNSKPETITLNLKYTNRKERIITGLKRISKPGLRVYAPSKDLPKVLNGLGIAIISTPNGLMTDKEARSKNLGGEVIAYIW